jgi:hypothetical protein
MDDPSVQLIAEQLGRFKDHFEARLGRLEDDQAHSKELTAEKMTTIKDDITQVKVLVQDHETRLRLAADAVISLRTTGGLLQAGQALLTLIAASIAAWLGGANK